MKILSSSGINTLIQLKQALSNLIVNSNNLTKLDSDSNKMVQAAVTILDLLITHNDSAFWQKSKNQHHLRDLVDIVVHRQDAYVPAIFNEQSYRLAKALQDVLDKINIATFLEKAALIFIRTLLGDPARFLGIVRRQLQFRLNIHEQLQQQEIYEAKREEIFDTFNNAMGGVYWKFDATRYTYLLFKEKYETAMRKLLADSRSIPYLRIQDSTNIPSIGSDGVVTLSQDPYELQCFNVRASRRILMQMVFSIEQYINDKLNALRLPPLTIVYDWYRDRFSKDKVKHFEDAFAQIIQDFDEEFSRYKKGSHLNFIERRSSLFQKKIEILEAVSVTLNRVIAHKEKYFCHEIYRFEAFKYLARAIDANSAWSANKNKSPGETSKLLAKYAERIYLLFLCDFSEENDYEVPFLFSSYEKDIWGMQNEMSVAASSSSMSSLHQPSLALTTREVINQLKAAKESESCLRVHNSGTKVNLRGLSTPSSSVAWMSGERGTIVRTADSGKTWRSSQIQNAEELFFRDIKAFNDKLAYAMSAGSGNKSRIYKTQDGGHTWSLQLQSNNPAEFFNCLAFWNSEHGIVLSDPVEGKFKIYMTNDGGGTWVPLSQNGMPLALQGESAFAASGSCMTVQGNLDAWFGTGGNTARVFHSRDGGITWSVTQTPLMQDSNSAGIFSIAFYDLNNGVIVGGDHKNPNKGGANVALTRDGGVTWERVDASPESYWSAVAFTPDHKNMMMVGSVQAACMNSEAPSQERQSWHANLNALSFWSENKVLAAGPEGMIVEFKTLKNI